MQLIIVLLVVGVTFGLCFLIDKGFTAVFRSKPQHRTGKAVRQSKRYVTIGLVIFVLGIASILAGISNGLGLLIGGIVVMLVGAALVTYYMTFGVFYDDDSFILTTFGRKSTTYPYRDIKSQQLYVTYGTVIIELHMADGRAVQLQTAMDGVYPFMDAAFAGWLRQTGRRQEDCEFHDPAKCCWFPTEG